MKTEASIPPSSDHPPQVLTIGPEATVDLAAATMRKHRVGCLIVTEAGGKLVGIVSERDIIAHVIGQKADPSQRLVGDIMTPDVVFCAADTPMSEIQDVMTTRRIRHLPIVADRVVVGIISSREVMAHQHAKDQAMRAAAEQVAKLSTSLKALDLDEVIGMIVNEVPRVFLAEKCVLCLFDQGYSSTEPLSVHRCGCRCPEEDLRQRMSARGVCDESAGSFGDVSQACTGRGGRSPSITIPLSLPGPFVGTGARCLPGYFCLCDFDACGLDPSDETSREVAQYKISLLQDILTANLTSAKVYEKYCEARRTAMADTLTGVGTRRFFADHLDAEYARSSRYNRPFSVAIWDVDNFKTINDSLGHVGGDQALVKLCQCISALKRSTDVFARYGGDEFVLLMPETDLDDAMVLLERIQGAVTRVPLPGGLSMTASCGVVAQDVSMGTSPTELVRRADMALYEAKRAGRDRIVQWDSLSQSTSPARRAESEEVQSLKRRVSDLMVRSERAVLQSLWGLVQALDARDAYTRCHSENVMRYSVGLAKTLGLPARDIAVIHRAAMIHDVGKLGVPDALMRKPATLTRPQRRIMEKHPVIAVRMLREMESLEHEIPIIRHHHERWDGGGYPDGIAGEAIELGARILAVADAFDAVTSGRGYREARSLPQASRTLAENAGSQFDPEVVAAMGRWVARIKADRNTDDELTADDLLDSEESSVLAA